MTASILSPGASMASLLSKDPGAPRNRAGDSIGTAFASLSTGAIQLPPQYSSLKQDLSQGHEKAILEGWHRLLQRLETQILPQIKELGTAMVPEVEFSEIVANNGKLPKSAEEKLKSVGTLIVRGVVPREEALGWKQQVRDYITANPSTGGFPANDIQVYEMYWSKAQLAARSHPNMLAAHKALNNVWTAAADDAVVLGEPISYADRLRIRTVCSLRLSLLQS